MATLGEVGESLTTELRQRVDRLVSAVQDDWPDFARISRLSDGVGEFADSIAELYTDLEQTLMGGLQREPGEKSDEGESQPRQRSEKQPQRSDAGNGATGNGDAGNGDAGNGDAGNEDVTKEELLERAREVNVQGRSSMTKDELAEAVAAEESVTKDELLERAREAEVEGRSSMTKDELRDALRDVRR